MNAVQQRNGCPKGFEVQIAHRELDFLEKSLNRRSVDPRFPGAMGLLLDLMFACQFGIVGAGLYPPSVCPPLLIERFDAVETL